ncbi:MAG TPA: hypothetical protein VGP26_02270 [Actinophytocola sp.]|nr:hypothetical protein [Actinophytocola sp.]
METDPSSNVVVFQLWRGREEHCAGRAPTVAEDSVRRAWDVARRSHGARPDEVVALVSEWEPSRADSSFIERTFPNAAVYYTFPRPAPGHWPEALEAARRQLGVTAADGIAGERPGEAERDGELLPMLWSESSPQADLLAAMPHYTLVPDGLHVSLAMVASGPNGRIGISHLTHRHFGPDGAWGEAGSFEELYEMARENLASGLRIEEYDNGVLDLHRDGGLAAPAVCLPNFHSYVSGLLGEERFVVGLSCPRHVIIAAESSPHAATVHSMIMESEYPASESLPSVLRVDRRGLTILAERR